MNEEQKLKQKEYDRLRYLNNKEKLKAQSKSYYWKNREKTSERHKRYYLKTQEHRREVRKKNYIKNKSHELIIQKQYQHKHFLKYRLNVQLYRALKFYTQKGKIMSSKKYGINYKAIVQKLTPLPFPIEERRNWHIDHIKPVSKFDLTNSEEVKKCFSAENLQWLLAFENLSKGDKY